MPVAARNWSRSRRVGPAGMGGGGAEQPGIDRLADGLAEIAGHLAGAGVMICSSMLAVLSMLPPMLLAGGPAAF